MQQKLLIGLLLCTLCACPTLAITRWFTSTFNDLKWTLYRYGYCYAGLGPISSTRMNETQYLVSQMKTFLDQGNYSSEQLHNISALMDRICLPNQTSPDYSVSMNIDLLKYNSSDARCQAIDDAMDSMYHVFKRAALNHSEVLDFNSVLFYPNVSDRFAYYNVIDLINTAWIKSATEIETVCAITNPIKEYASNQMETMLRYNVTGANRREDKPEPRSSALLHFINRLLDPILGLQKRLYWEGSSRLEQVRSATMSGLVSMRDGIGAGGRGLLRFVTGSNSTLSATNSTKANPIPISSARINETQVFPAKTSAHPSNATLSSPPATLKNYTSTSSTTLPPSRVAIVVANPTLNKPVDVIASLNKSMKDDGETVAKWRE